MVVNKVQHEAVNNLKNNNIANNIVDEYGTNQELRRVAGLL